MSDVFVSYKAEDRRRVKPLVDALEADGLSVWWDAQIGGGDEWRRSIERELDAAKCVLVVWSKRSTAPEGRFVRDEATRAMERGVYLPVRIDNVRLPLGFGETQALNLTSWRAGRDDARFQAVLGAVRSTVSGKPREGSRGLVEERFSRRGLLALAGAGAGVTAIGAGVAGWLFLRSSSAEAAGTIAVLPFENLSNDPAQAYFSDGLAEELRSALSRAGLQVVGRTSSEVVKDTDAETAARKLGVANILTGSVRRSPSTIRVSAQLIKGSDGLERWSQDYDRKPGDELTIQSDIAQNVAQALSATLGAAGKAALTLGGTTNAAAQDLFLKAREMLRNSDDEASYRSAIGLLNSAITLDPRFADAIAFKSLAINYMTGSIPDAPQFDAGYAQAAQIARQAIAIAPNLSIAHVALATAYEFQLKLGAALAEYRIAQRLHESDVANQLHYVIFLTRMGAFDAALDIVHQAQARDPLNSLTFSRAGYVLTYARRYADAVASLQKAAQLAPSVSRNHSTLGLCLMQLGRNADAEAEYRKAAPSDIYGLTGHAVLYARQGNMAASEAAIARAQKIFGDSASYQYAEIYAQRGDKERAFAALSRAQAIHDPGLTTMKVDFLLDPIRSDPRFIALEERLNFPPVSAA